MLFHCISFIISVISLYICVFYLGFMCLHFLMFICFVIYTWYYECILLYILLLFTNVLHYIILLSLLLVGWVYIVVFLTCFSLVRKRVGSRKPESEHLRVFLVLHKSSNININTMSTSVLSKDYIRNKYAPFQDIPIIGKYFPYLGVWGHTIIPRNILGASNTYQKMLQTLAEVCFFLCLLYALCIYVLYLAYIHAPPTSSPILLRTFHPIYFLYYILI